MTAYTVTIVTLTNLTVLELVTWLELAEVEWLVVSLAGLLEAKLSERSIFANFREKDSRS